MVNLITHPKQSDMRKGRNMIFEWATGLCDECQLTSDKPVDLHFIPTIERALQRNIYAIDAEICPTKVWLLHG